MCADRANPEHVCVHDIEIVEMRKDINQLQDTFTQNMIDCKDSIKDVLAILQSGNGLVTRMFIAEKEIVSLFKKDVEISGCIVDINNRQDVLKNSANKILISVIVAGAFLLLDIILRIPAVLNIM